MLRVLPSTFKPVLQQIKVSISCASTDFWLDKIRRESRHTQELLHLLQNKFASGQSNAQHVLVLLQKVEPDLLQDRFQSRQ